MRFKKNCFGSDSMDKNKIIIIALIAIIAALLVGVVAMMPNMNKQDTKLTFKSNSTLDEGSSLKIKLTDDNGTAIANQTVNVTITDGDESSDYHSVVTNEKGIGKLKLDKSPGKYNVTISYGGNDQYNGCNATKKITIKEEVVEEVVEAPVEQSYSEPKYVGEDGSPISEADYRTLQVYGKSANSPEEWEAQKASLGY